MSYYIDPNDNDAIVMSGHASGISESELGGISDMRNMNIISIPGEASVNFSTSKISSPTISSGTITSVDAGTDIITFSGAANLETYMAVVFAGSLPTGLTAGTVYWVEVLSSTTIKVYSDLALNTLINLTSTTTGGTFTVYSMTEPKYFAYNKAQSSYFLVDSSGQVWAYSANIQTAPNGYWIFTGNVGGTGAKNGNGLVLYTGSDGAQWLFVFANSRIDYTRAEKLLINNTSWVYGWKPSNGTTGNAGGYLNTGTNTNNPHEAMVPPDNRVYYTDANYIGRWYQTDPATAFVPTNTATYTFDQTPLLPFSDIAQCLSFLGTNLMIGGQANVIYPWDRYSPNFAYPILLPEYNISKLVTVNTTTFIFSGNRGRIYVTNGTNVNLYKKLPDYLSGTVEPYYTWGGACSNKNQLFFSALVSTNAGVATSTMGGVWAIDLDTEALRLANQLSYGTYAGYCTAMIPNFSTTAAGTGLYMGWNNGSSGYGVDTTTSNPYTGSQAYIDYDYIPVGNYLKPKTYHSVEYKLSKPMVTGESVSIYYRTSIGNNFTLIFTSNGTTGSGSISDINQSVNFQNAQWLQLRVVTNSTTSSPSYTRLTEIRIK